MLDHKTQKNNYFEYRNISEENYSNLQIPLWIKYEIENKDTKILDYGCGFGQILKALKNDSYQNVYGGNIEVNAIQSCRDNNLIVAQLDLEDLKNPYEFKFDIIKTLGFKTVTTTRHGTIYLEHNNYMECLPRVMLTENFDISYTGKIRQNIS